MRRHPKKVIENQLPVEELLRRAEEGDADCQYWAGVRFLQGDGVPEDPRRAIELCLKASEQNDARAWALLGYCCTLGIGIGKDQETAIAAYGFAADEEYPPAMFTLGSFCLAGNGVIKSAQQALEWFEKAADMGMAEALVTLGDLYRKGEEVPKDIDKALNNYRRAAILGDFMGQAMVSLSLRLKKISDFERIDFFEAMVRDCRLQGNLITASRYLDELVEVAPDRPCYRRQLADIYFDLGWRQHAVVELSGLEQAYWRLDNAEAAEMTAAAIIMEQVRNPLQNSAETGEPRLLGPDDLFSFGD